MKLLFAIFIRSGLVVWSWW